jgi:hypothetical protein
LASAQLLCPPFHTRKRAIGAGRNGPQQKGTTAIPVQDNSLVGQWHAGNSLWRNTSSFWF